MSRKFRSAHRPTGRGLTLLLIAAAAALCPAAAVRALGATHRPDPPTHLRATGVTRTALTLAWMRSTGPGRIARYRVFQDERRIGHTLGKTRFAVSGLRCGRTYSFSVRAVDGRGRVSHPASRLIHTAACAASDTEPPSTPADLAQSEPARTGLDLTWSPSVDNVRVSGYRVTQDGVQIARTAETSLSVGGLSCGASYAFTVTAYDRAGNRSMPASLTASTAACAPPAQCTGVAVAPGADLETLAAVKPAGTVFCIAPGTYRVRSEIKARDGQQFIGTGPGVVVTGGTQLSGFVHAGGVWTAAGTTTAAYAPGDGFSGYVHPQSPYANDVTFDGLPLEKVGVRLRGKVYGDPESAVGPGAYFVDYDAGTVTLGSDPAGHDVELGVGADGFGSQAAGLVIRDLSLDLFTSGGIDMRGVAHGWTVEGVDVTAAHDIGIKLLDASSLEGGSIAWSGRYGLSVHGAGVTIDGIDVSHSDAAHYRDSTTGGCVAAGGSKFVRTVGLVLRNSTFHDNLCNGIWLDVDTYHSTLVGNSSVRNERDGIRVEVSHMTAISDNTVSDNGGWGIYLSNAPDADVHGNTVANNRTGAIVLHWSGRTSPTSAYGSYATSDTDVHDNTMIITGSGQSVGIFDTTGTAYACSAAAANRFHANHYVLPDATGSWFHLGSKLTWSAWRTAGMDTEYGLM